MADRSNPQDPPRDVSYPGQQAFGDTEYLMIGVKQPTRARSPIIITIEHAHLMEELSAHGHRSWGEKALLGCLCRLESGGPTEAAEVKVHEGWAADDEFCLIYTSPWGPTVGVRVHRDGDQFQSAYTDEPSPDEFGVDFADFTIAEPLGTRADHLVLDSDGLGWWGDQPLPPARLRRE
ncbi:hypothetical protein ACEXQE_06695 [Herbiconiux sp. P17]|uniref:hypothetical protein n=1 Tax=Herbiconiux wuyangfengii TaxID=3342794 RepID=UPI0035BA57F0